jgi:hypothetical protein
MRSVAATLAALAALAAEVALGAGCGDPAARVTLAPVIVAGGSCGRPTAGTGLIVTAFGDGPDVARAVALDGAFALGDLPRGTRQLGVEVVAGGSVLAAGKTAPLDFLGLPDGAQLPVMMAPPDGFCPVGPMTEPRVAPLLAPAGSGVLVVGGTGSAGALATAEYYDPTTGTFTAVDVPEVLATAQGFVGAALTPLADGRVALSEQALAIFDPVTRQFGEPVLIDFRAFHAGIGLPGGDLLLAGGCAGASGATCVPPVRKSSKRYRLAALGTPTVGPTLTSDLVGAIAIDEGVDAAGRHPYLIAGGRGTPGAGTLLDLDGGASSAVGGLGAVLALLDGGALLSAFAPDGQPASGQAAILAPGAATAAPAAAAPALVGVRLVTLEDGAVIGIGGTPGGELLRYAPAADSWQLAVPTGDAPPATQAPSTLRLADGSVLVVGGLGAAGPSAAAWIYRPSLVGPFAGSVVAVPAADTGGGVLTPTDPAHVVRDAAAWRLTAADDAGDLDGGRGLVGGPRMTEGAVTAVVRVRRGGVALVAAEASPGEALMAIATAGGPARLVRLHGGVTTTLCTGAIAALPATATVTAALTVRGGAARLTIDGVEVAACAATAAAAGAWGVAASGPGADVAISAVTAER